MQLTWGSHYPMALRADYVIGGGKGLLIRTPLQFGGGILLHHSDGGDLTQHGVLAYPKTWFQLPTTQILVSLVSYVYGAEY